MKNKLVLFFGILAVFSFVSLPCYAQSTNNDSRLTGTWIDVDGTSTIVFNSDGTGSMDRERIMFGAVEGKMVIYAKGQQFLIDYIISNNGNTLLLMYYLPQTGGRYGQILKKRT